MVLHGQKDRDIFAVIKHCIKLLEKIPQHLIHPYHTE